MSVDSKQTDTTSGSVKKRGLLRTILWTVLILTAVTAMAFLLYVGRYYDTAPEAMDYYLNSPGRVQLHESNRGIFLDGPGQERALVFYPGGKVEYTAYLPLLYKLAEGKEGIDCFLVRMPFHLAIFGKNAADKIVKEYAYSEWYIGGHSLGGAVASMYAADHEELSGLILLAAYPTGPVHVPVIEIYGSADGVLRQKKREEADAYLPDGARVEVLEGGNHAQFGNYGIQKGDGEAAITAEEQQDMTVRLIREWIGNGNGTNDGNGTNE